MLEYPTQTFYILKQMYYTILRTLFSVHGHAGFSKNIVLLRLVNSAVQLS
jgi:hypothetical protein